MTQLQTLANLTIAVPETRELDVFSELLERRGAKVVRCPLVAILDAPDPAPVLAWVHAFNAGGCDDVIFLTGEGLRRIVRCIDTHEPTLRDAFVTRLASVRKITRGPKPAKALRELGLKPDLTAVQPTTAGVIESLRTEDLAGRRVGVQLYGTDPNRTLIDFLVAAGAQPLTVAPYIYASQADDTAVSDLLTRMATGEVNVIAFTSSPQVERLFAVGPPDLVKAALERVQVAAIGPVVAAALAKHDVRVRLMPEDSFFMKPLATALEAELGAAPRARG